jgi:hypothetical protein
LNLLKDIITYIRRLIKTPSDAVITDDLLIDYINRFWIIDVDARMQLFDLKTVYQFQTTPGITDYNMPLYSFQSETTPGGQDISYYPVYQGFLAPAKINGINVPFYTQKSLFYNLWPNYVQALPNIIQGNGGTNYTIRVPFLNSNLPLPNINNQGALIPGHVDITGIIATQINPVQDPILINTGIGQSLNLNVPVTSVTYGVIVTATGPNGQNIVVTDSGQFLSNNTDGCLYGLMMAPGTYPTGNQALVGGYSTTLNTVNYNSGVINCTFPQAIPPGVPINVECYFIEQGLPRAILYFNNTLTIRDPPNSQYLVEIEAYLSPAAFFSTSQSIPFAYMTEYISKGAARKLLSDTGDWDQFDRYEPLFLEQEMLVWKRSQRQFTATRTDTIFSNSGHSFQLTNQGNGGT